MPRGAVDERGFEMVRRIRLNQREMHQLTLTAFKALVREQYLMLLIDPEASVAAIPSMLPADRELCVEALDLIKRVLSACEKIEGDVAERLRRIDRLFRVDRELFGVATPAALPSARKVESRKAS
jgi:hypothetical protein